MYGLLMKEMDTVIITLTLIIVLYLISESLYFFNSF